MQLFRLFVLTLAVTFFLNCSSLSTSDAGPYSEPYRELEKDCKCDYTYRTPQMGFFGFIQASERMVASKIPEWYVPGTDEHPLIVHASPFMLGKYGQAWKDEEGNFHVSYGQSALFLPTIEDMASIVLHEHVHVKIWEEIASHDEWSLECRISRHELIANKVVIENYYRLGYTPHMYLNARILYGKAKRRAQNNKCPVEVMSNMPRMPLPKMNY